MLNWEPWSQVLQANMTVQVEMSFRVPDAYEQSGCVPVQRIDTHLLLLSSTSIHATGVTGCTTEQLVPVQTMESSLRVSLPMTVTSMLTPWSEGPP